MILINFFLLLFATEFDTKYVLVQLKDSQETVLKETRSNDENSNKNSIKQG